MSEWNRFSLRFLVAAAIFASVSFSYTQSTPSSIPSRLSLAEAEALLEKRNLAVLAAKYQVDASRAQTLVARYKPNPVLTLGLEQTPFYSPASGSYPRLFNTSADAGSNPVYTMRLDKIWERGGKREYRSAEADEQLKASEAQMLDALRLQLYELRRAFTAALLASETLKLSQQADAQYAETEKLTQLRVDQGDIAKMEIDRVTASRLQYQQAVLQARTAYDAAIRDLLNYLGATEKDISSPGKPAAVADGNTNNSLPLELSGELNQQPLPITLEELHSAALASRPDVIATRHQLAAAQSATQLAQAQTRRDVDFGYEYQRVGNDHTVGMVAQFPLFLSNNQKAYGIQAQAQERSVDAQLKQAELQAITDVDKAYGAYLSARRVLELYNTENLSQVDKLRSIALISFQNGASSLFELLDAQRTYLAAMTAYTQARADYQMSLWGLELAVGRLLR